MELIANNENFAGAAQLIHAVD